MFINVNEKLHVSIKGLVNTIGLETCKELKGMQETISLSNNRLLGRPAPIFYFNCEHVLFKYIVKQKQTKFCGFYRKNFQKSNLVRGKF